MKKVYNNPNEYWYYNRRYDSKEPTSMKGCFYCLIGIVVFLILTFIFQGCTTVKYIPVETVKTEYKTNTVYDSVYFETVKHDSVFIETKGDTVFVNKYHCLYKDRWKEKLVTDTLIKTDTIQVPYPVEKELSKWDKRCLQLGYISIIVGILLVLIILVGFLVRNKR